MNRLSALRSAVYTCKVKILLYFSLLTAAHLLAADAWSSVTTKSNLARPAAVLSVAASSVFAPALSATSSSGALPHSAPLVAVTEETNPSGLLWVAPPNETVARHMSHISKAIQSTGARRIHPLLGNSWASNDLQRLIPHAKDPKTTHYFTVEPLNELVALDEELARRIHQGELTAFESIRGNESYFVLVDANFLR